MRPNTLVRDFDPTPLSPESEQTLRCARVFLYAIRRPEWIANAMLAGYGPDTHRDGVWTMSQLSGERPMWEWREWRALRPPRDPDLPDLVQKLDEFSMRWQERALAVARTAIDEPDDREEVVGYVQGFQKYPSKTWHAKATVQRLKHMSDVPMEFYQVVARSLEAEGFKSELPDFEETLATVQDYIRSLAVDDQERQDIHSAREDWAPRVRHWLDERRAQFAHLDITDRTVLALGELVPPPGFEPDIAFLVGFGAEAKA
ncbi:MAG: hypothetical protein MUF54_15040 [Polyangiaceae bacterium]|jgi:hypothetical protein|nr:hypothetical protein [Polyangiaceae bacterium]